MGALKLIDLEIDVSFMGKWTYEDYSGYTWKLSYIKLKNEINESEIAIYKKSFKTRISLHICY